MKTGLKMTEELADLPVLDGTDFDYPEHAPQWIPAGSARICSVCGALDLPDPDAPMTVPGTAWRVSRGTERSACEWSTECSVKK